MLVHCEEHLKLIGYCMPTVLQLKKKEEEGAPAAGGGGERGTGRRGKRSDS